MTCDSPPLLTEVRAGIATLQLNRPEQLNALSESVLEALQRRLDELAVDPGLRCVILTASGRAFCAGHDLEEMRRAPTLEYSQSLFARCSRVMQSIRALPVPVIAQVQGIATAAGCQLVGSCDLAIASEDARFAVSGINVGLFCSTPMVALSRNVTRKHAMEMLLTGEMIDAPTAWRFGLVNEVVPAAELADRTRDLARRLAAKSGLTLAIGKEAFYRQAELPLTEAYAYASAVMTRNLQALDAHEGIDAFLDKRPPIWCGR